MLPDMQLKKVKDVPRLLHRLRTTLGSTNIRDFSQLLDRSAGHKAARSWCAAHRAATPRTDGLDAQPGVDGGAEAVLVTVLI